MIIEWLTLGYKVRKLNNLIGTDFKTPGLRDFKSIKEMDREILLIAYWNNHPKYNFFISLPANSHVLDLGCGEGGLHFWRTWNNLDRSDIKLFGVDIKKGKYTDYYEEFVLVDITKDSMPWEDNFFDAIIFSHALEHLAKVDILVNDIYRLLKTDGQIYIETPAPISHKLPSKMYLYQQTAVNVSCLNFYDDATHVQMFDHFMLRKFVSACGLQVTKYGVITHKELDNLLLWYGILHNDSEISTYAVWSALGWAHFIIGRKGNDKEILLTC